MKPAPKPAPKATVVAADTDDDDDEFFSDEDDEDAHALPPPPPAAKPSPSSSASPASPAAEASRAPQPARQTMEEQPRDPTPTATNNGAEPAPTSQPPADQRASRAATPAAASATPAPATPAAATPTAATPVGARDSDFASVDGGDAPPGEERAGAQPAAKDNQDAAGSTDQRASEPAPYGNDDVPVGGAESPGGGSESRRRRRGERPPMDFTVEPMEDILEREHREFLERRRREGPKRMSAETLARLAAPKARRRKPGAKDEPASPEPDAKAITHDDDGWGVWDDAIDVPMPAGDAAGGQGAAADRTAEPDPAAATRDSPATGPAAGSPEKPRPVRLPYRKVTGRGLALDHFYVMIQGAGREASFALDRKTMFAAALEATNFPRGGTLVFRGLPVHNHATAVTLGLRQGPDHVTLLLFMSREELEEETARRRLVAEEAAHWGHCLAALVAALEDARKPMRRHFVDADATSAFAEAA